MTGFGVTDVGRKRLVNQDSYSAQQMPGGCFAVVVCDGMGGTAGGSIAASIAKDVFLTELERLLRAYFDDSMAQGAPSVAIPRMMAEAVSAGNAFTYDLSVRDPGLKGMGTTLVALVLYKENAYVCNVGDSRLYAFREKSVRQITKDHSYVQELYDSGRISAKQAKESPHKNIITKAVGVTEKLSADTFVVPLANVQYLLLCTDGLSNYLENEDLCKIVYSDVLGLEKKARTLVDLANGRGGEDNVTVYLIGFGDQAPGV